MTKFAIFTDIHASLEALYAILIHAKEEGAEKIICLGDIIGGPNPKECTKLIKEHCDVVIKGNHDKYFLKHPYAWAVGDAATSKSDRWTKEKWFDPNELRDEKDKLIGEKFATLKEKVDYLLKHDPPKNREEFEKYRKLINLADNEEYFDFLDKAELEVVLLEKEKRIYSHGLSSILFQYSKEIGVDKEGCEAFEDTYIITQEQWKRKNEKKDRSNDKERFAIAEKAVKFLPEGVTLFVGHSHEPYEVIYRKKNTRIINPGAGFDFRNLGHDIATYSLFDTEAPINYSTIKRVRYNRLLTDSKILANDIIDNYYGSRYGMNME